MPKHWTLRLADGLKQAPGDSCWEWQGSVLPDGYGLMRRDGKQVLTHRLAYEKEYGPIPPGLFVCHKCDNPPCGRPDHLFLGTHKENMADMVSKGYHKLLTPRGDSHKSSKLSEADVLAIRDLAGKESLRALSRRFGVVRGQIQHILKRKSWKHLPISKVP